MYSNRSYNSQASDHPCNSVIAIICGHRLVLVHPPYGHLISVNTTNKIMLGNTKLIMFDIQTRCLPENVQVDRDDIYSTTGINRLHDRAETHLLKIMYKRAHSEVYLDPVEVRTRLHDGPVLLVPFPNNKSFRKSVIFRGSSAWNNLTPDERNIPTFDCFKNMLKNKLTGLLL